MEAIQCKNPILVCRKFVEGPELYKKEGCQCLSPHCEATYDSPTNRGAEKATPMGARSEEPIMPDCGAELPLEYLLPGPPARQRAGRNRMHDWNAGRNPLAP